MSRSSKRGWAHAALVLQLLLLLLLLSPSLGQQVTVTSGWLLNTTYSSNDCSGSIDMLTIRSFDTCYYYPGQQTGVRAYCTTTPGNWGLYEREYSDSTCTNPRAVMTTPTPLVSGSTCDGKGSAVSCAADLSSAPLKSSPRGFITSVYSSASCDEQHVYERVITPQGGCTVIRVERTDTMANGQQAPARAGVANFRVESCELVNDGYVVFGTLHDDRDVKCRGPGHPTSHVLPRGCVNNIDNTLFSSLFSCG